MAHRAAPPVAWDSRRPQASARFPDPLRGAAGWGHSPDGPVLASWPRVSVDRALRRITSFLGADNFLAANPHGLDPHHFIADDAHEIDVGRRLAIDPLFVLSLAVFLPYLLWSFAPGVHYHFRVHADQHTMCS